MYNILAVFFVPSKRNIQLRPLGIGRVVNGKTRGKSTIATIP
jgi:hypothetical protein